MATPISGKYVVGKPFVRDGVRLESGTVVDVTGWRNANKLLAYRYLRPLPAGTPVEKKSKPVEADAKPAKKAAVKKASPKPAAKEEE